MTPNRCRYLLIGDWILNPPHEAVSTIMSDTFGGLCREYEDFHGGVCGAHTFESYVAFLNEWSPERLSEEEEREIADFWRGAGADRLLVYTESRVVPELWAPEDEQEDFFMSLGYILIDLQSSEVSAAATIAFWLASRCARRAVEIGTNDTDKIAMATIANEQGYLVFPTANGGRVWLDCEDDETGEGAALEWLSQFETLTDADRVEFRLRFPDCRLVLLP